MVYQIKNSIFAPSPKSGHMKMLFVTKIVLTWSEKKLFAKFIRSLEQFIQTMKGQNNFW